MPRKRFPICTISAMLLTWILFLLVNVAFVSKFTSIIEAGNSFAADNKLSFLRC